MGMPAITSRDVCSRFPVNYIFCFKAKYFARGGDNGIPREISRNGYIAVRYIAVVLYKLLSDALYICGIEICRKLTPRYADCRRSTRRLPADGTACHHPGTGHRQLRRTDNSSRHHKILYICGIKASERNRIKPVEINDSARRLIGIPESSRSMYVHGPTAVCHRVGKDPV